MRVIVLGMHRSGTSLACGLLNVAGVYFGEESGFIKTNIENPKGFWEREDVRKLNDMLMLAMDCDWGEISSIHEKEIPENTLVKFYSEAGAILQLLEQKSTFGVTGLKEPRLCLLMPFWQHLLDENDFFVLVHRDPEEISISLKNRNRMPVEVSNYLTEGYLGQAICAIKGKPHYIVSYKDLILDPVGSTNRIIEAVNSTGQKLATPDNKKLAEYSTPSLHRSRPSGGPFKISKRLQRWCDSLSHGELPRVISTRLKAPNSVLAFQHSKRFEEYHKTSIQLSMLESQMGHRDREMEQSRTELSRSAQNLATKDSQLKSAPDRIDTLQADTAKLNSELADFRVKVEAMKNSYSWKVTAPLRQLFDLINTAQQFLRRHITLTNTVRPKPHELAQPTYVVPANKRKLRKLPLSALVITWDVGHNPLGRSYMLAEVLERVVRNVIIIGFQFPRYGDDLWEPLRNSRIPVISLPGTNFPDFIGSLERISERIDPDIVFACKARLPSVQLGAMIKSKLNCPLIIDIDDHELTFFKDAREVSLEQLEKMKFGSAKDEIEPYEKLWTCLALNARRFADRILVSNETLLAEFGGTIVPHVRDEKRFDPKLYDRRAVRAEFGIPKDALVTLFFGTPRQHKGIDLVAKAVANMDDERALLVIVGDAPDRRETASLVNLAGKRVRFIGNQPFERIPAIVSMADAICLAQDPSHPISGFQLPAKAIDAVAMGIPLLVTATPPLKRLINLAVATEIKPNTIDLELECALKQQDKDSNSLALKRKVFLDHFSYAAAARTLHGVIIDAMERGSSQPEFASNLARLFRAQRRVLGVTETQESITDTSGKDFVLFWKQNDTKLYGRRVDMFIKYLESRNDVRKIVVFDAPIFENDLMQLRVSGGCPSQNRWIYQKTYEKLLGKLDSEKVSYNVFVNQPGIYAPPGQKLYGRKPLSSGYLPFIQKVLSREKVSPSDSAFWFYPKNFMAPEIIKHFKPGKIVVDVVDDHRAWPGISYKEISRLTENYRELLAFADLVFVNCEPMLDQMKEFFPDVHLVPNGFDSSPPEVTPTNSQQFTKFMANEKPVIGYVGNLEAKIDLELIEKIAQRFPQFQVVLIGSTHMNPAARDLKGFSNIILPGVVPYEEIGAWISRFDVTIMPYLDIKMVKYMNPLKLYVYLSWGIPVVATKIENLGYSGSFLKIASNHDEFLQSIAEFIRRKPVDTDELCKFVQKNDWRSRFKVHIDSLIV